MDRTNNIKAKLTDIKKTNPYDVPDGYFDSFQNRMAEKISLFESKKHHPSVFWIPRARLAPLLSITGIALIIICILIFLPDKKSHSEYTATELAEIYTYQAIEGTSEIELIKELEEISMETDKAQVKAENKDIDPEEAINILSNENIDLNLIIDAL